MKWYRPIDCDNTVDNPLVCESSNFCDYNNFGQGNHWVEGYFYQGKEITDWQDGVFITTLKEENDGIPDDVVQNSYMIPVFSRKLVDAIIEAGITGFQFLPIDVLNFRQQKVGEHFIANCTTMIDAFDYEKSTYHRFPDDFINPNARGKVVASKFVLISEKLTDVDVFRLQGQERACFVSEKFVKLFRKNRFTGYSFRKADLS